MQTRDGRSVTIETKDKPGMSVFKVFGSIDGQPCHWTEAGRFRMDGTEDPRDIHLEWVITDGGHTKEDTDV